MPSPVVQLRIPEDMLAAIDGVCDGNRSAWILALVERELLADGAGPIASGPAASSLAAIVDGQPSPGVICMTPGCLQRDTRKYGLRRVPFCPACHAALEGRTYQRQIPPGAARLIRHGAA